MKHIVTAQRTYTDGTMTNVGTFRQPKLVPAARITAERSATARARLVTVGRVAGRNRKQRAE